MSEITEYQKVASMVCLDIDTLSKTAENNPDMALELMRKLKTMKDELINDEENLNSRYSACCNLFNLKT